ncbi:MAG: esterase/lipase family protein [Lysobacterales bacterium]
MRQMERDAEVVLVHGLWHGSWAMMSLARRLRRAGYALRFFKYRPTVSSLASHASDLAQFVGRSEATKVHYVGHSLGGLVILQMLCSRFAVPSGRVVLLGTPLQGSEVVRRVARLPGAHAFLGQAAEGLARGVPGLVEGHEIGVIAGTRAVGIGRLLGQPAQGSDGTVALAETDAPYLSGRIALPVSHTGLLYSAAVAQSVSSFLESGSFSQGSG